MLNDWTIREPTKQPEWRNELEAAKNHSSLQSEFWNIMRKITEKKVIVVWIVQNNSK